MLKILYLSPRWTRPWLVVKYADALAQGGAEVSIFSTPENLDGFDRGIVKSDIPFVVFPRGRYLPLVWRLRLLKRLRFYIPPASLLHSLLRYKPDILIAGAPEDLLFATLTAQMQGTRLVYMPFEYYPGLTDLADDQRDNFARFESWCAPRIDALICLGDKLSELYEHEPKLGGRVHTVYSGIPRETPYTPRGLRARIGAPPDVVIAFYSGLITEARGFLDVLRALRETPSNVWFVTLGYDPHHLQAEVARMGLSGRVHMLEAVPQDELMDYTREADIGVIPIRSVSTSYRYCNPGKLFEFLGAGLPLIVNGDLEQLKWYVETHELGEVYRGESTASLAAALTRLAGDPVYRKRCSANALRTHASEACWEIQSERLRSAVLGTRAAPAKDSGAMLRNRTRMARR